MKTYVRILTLLVVMATALPTFSLAGAATADHSRHGTGAPKNDGSYRPVLHDLDLLDQNGRRVKFVRDVIGDHIVVINFTYTTCTTICPILDSILVNLQERLGARLGAEVTLATLSIDPVVDTPARLKQHARKLGARDGWTLLTGRKSDVDTILKGLEMWAPDIFNHPPAVIVGDQRTGVWKRLYGYPSAAKVQAAVDELSRARGGAGDGHSHSRSTGGA